MLLITIFANLWRKQVHSNREFIFAFQIVAFVFFYLLSTAEYVKYNIFYILTMTEDIIQLHPMMTWCVTQWRDETDS